MNAGGEGGGTDACELPQRFISAYGVVDGVPAVAVASDAPGVTQSSALRSIPVVPATQGEVNLPASAVKSISHLAVLLEGKVVGVVVHVAAVLLWWRWGCVQRCARAKQMPCGSMIRHTIADAATASVACVTCHTTFK